MCVCVLVVVVVVVRGEWGGIERGGGREAGEGRAGDTGENQYLALIQNEGRAPSAGGAEAGERRRPRRNKTAACYSNVAFNYYFKC